MSRIKSFLEYSRTFLITILAILCVLFVVFMYLQHRIMDEYRKQQIEEDTVEYSLVGMMIEKYKYREKKHPDDYTINLKLGLFYEIYRDFKNAEIEYQAAIMKAPYDEFKPKFKLANLYVRQGRVDEAQKVMDDILERHDDQLIEYKAEIYGRIGDYYYDEGDYASAIPKYLKSLDYFKIINSSSSKEIVDSLASAYVYIAERFVDNSKLEDAVICLEKANSLVNSVIIKYKLAILLIPTDPQRAYEYFTEVFKKQPALISYDVYYNFLLQLADEAEYKGDSTTAELYRFRAKRFKDYYDANILSVDDLSLEMSEAEMSLSRWTDKYKINLALILKNTSKRNLNSLYADIEFVSDGKVFQDYKTQIINKNSPLASGETSPMIFITTEKVKTTDDQITGDFTANIYVSKLENSYKIKLGEIPVKLVKKQKKYYQPFSLKEFWRKLFHQPRKLKHAV